MADIEIATHVQCLEGMLPDTLERFEQVVRSLETETSSLHTWLGGIHWPPDGTGFAELGEPIALHAHNPEHTVLTVKPYVLGYTAASGSELSGSWIQLSLVLENGSEEYEIYVSNAWKYPQAFGTAIFEVMWRLSRGFPASGVYFNDGPSVNRPWEALIKGTGHLWAFDIAIIPEQLAARFHPQPDNYARMALPEAIGFARLRAWVDNPLAQIQI